MNEFWREDAACKGRTDLFFPAHRERGPAKLAREMKALAMCQTCTVQAECRRDAVADPEHAYGIWAGEPADTFVSLPQLDKEWTLL